ncbi:hypothetical protein JOC74_002766 [Bacillus capparidis]|uniref:Uncharacterized protein n=1 Tax=Bacillus capparidis TaxID=1840411 RepID=A0ABS4CY31_9BACI|nr:hypothetical protein [Bacillus capparidis]
MPLGGRFWIACQQRRGDPNHSQGAGRRHQSDRYFQPLWGRRIGENHRRGDQGQTGRGYSGNEILGGAEWRAKSRRFPPLGSASGRTKLAAAANGLYRSLSAASPSRGRCFRRNSGRAERSGARRQDTSYRHFQSSSLAAGRGAGGERASPLAAVCQRAISVLNS